MFHDFRHMCFTNALHGTIVEDKCTQDEAWGSTGLRPVTIEMLLNVHPGNESEVAIETNLRSAWSGGNRGKVTMTPSKSRKRDKVRIGTVNF